MGALRDRDQTIATLEAEVAEVCTQLGINFQQVFKCIFQVISKLNLLQTEKGRLIQNEGVGEKRESQVLCMAPGVQV